MTQSTMVTSCYTIVTDCCKRQRTQTTAVLDAADVSVTNNDDETAGHHGERGSSGPTTEAGGTATFTVVLEQ